MLLNNIIATILKLHGEVKPRIQTQAVFMASQGDRACNIPAAGWVLIKYSACDFSKQTLICLESILIFQSVCSLGQGMYLPVFTKHLSTFGTLIRTHF